MEAEALNARAALSGDEVDIFQLDAVPEPHGHESRLARTGVSNSTRYGSHEYSLEELCAEMGAAFLAAAAGIDTDGLLDNSAAYIASWVKALRDNKKLVVFAAAKAQKAADHILARSFEAELEARAA